jgi:hypothetical protein
MAFATQGPAMPTTTFLAVFYRPGIVVYAHHFVWKYTIHNQSTCAYFLLPLTYDTYIATADMASKSPHSEEQPEGGSDRPDINDSGSF